MTPEERLIEEIKANIPDGKYCYRYTGDCYYLKKANCCALFSKSYEHIPLRSKRCLELKPIKENNHE